jgi:glucokinase
MKLAIGIDIGGTKISIVLGNSTGKIYNQKVIPTLVGVQTQTGIRDLSNNLVQLIASFPDRKKILGIGVGIPGPVDNQKGIVPSSPHLGGWQGAPLKKILQKASGLPVIMANDANAAALGEKIFGQGRDINDFIYMTVSTGIGGGVVINHKLLEGISHVAGEVGHMTIVPNGEACKCGKNGCLEAYASGTAIGDFANKFRHQLSKKTQQLIGKRPVTAKDMGIAARDKDAFALEVYERAGFYLGIGIANLLNILNPQKVILGGGVFKSAPTIFWKSMLAACERDAWPQAWQAVQIVKSNLKGHVGDLGALALVFASQK